MDERVPALQEREEELRLVEDFFVVRLLLERDCAMLNSTPLFTFSIEQVGPWAKRILGFYFITNAEGCK